VTENEAKENALVPRILRVAKPGDEAAPPAAMRRCQACSGAHNLAIAARLASPGALPDNTMLAASRGLCGRRTRKLALFLAGSNSPRAYFRPHRQCSARDNGKEENLNHKDWFQAHLEGAV